MTSNIIRTITLDEKLMLLTELIRSDCWQEHGGFLRDGKSIHVKWVSGDLNHKYDLINQFPETMSLLQSLFPEREFARIFWHRLSKDDKIYPHDDTVVRYIGGNKLQCRCQIYLDIPDNFVLVADNEVKAHKLWANTIIDFDFRQLHSYENNSDYAVYLLVADVLNDGVSINYPDRNN